MRSIILATALLISACLPGKADPESCLAATDQYLSVLDEISDAIRAYAMCVYDSQGGVDCADEFAGLGAAQEHFQSAVTLYQSECADAGQPPGVSQPPAAP